MASRRISLVFVSFVVAFAFVGFTGSACAGVAGAAGIYKGTYAGFAAGGDHGTVTIVINEQGGTACNFHTTVGNYDSITTGGSVLSTSPYLNLVCGGSGISNGGYWEAQSAAPSMLGGTLSGTWTSAFGAQSESPAPPTGSFETNYVSALTPLDPAAIAGMWAGPSFWGGLNILPANAGLVVSYIGVTDTYETSLDGQLVGPPPGSPLWLLSDVGPTTILPGTAITLTMYAPSAPPPTLTIPWPAPSLTTWGTMALTFIDCHTASIILNGPVTSGGSAGIDMIAGVAGSPGC